MKERDETDAHHRELCFHYVRGAGRLQDVAVVLARCARCTGGSWVKSIPPPSLSLSISLCACVCERERERELEGGEGRINLDLGETSSFFLGASYIVDVKGLKIRANACEADFCDILRNCFMHNHDLSCFCLLR